MRSGRAEGGMFVLTDRRRALAGVENEGVLSSRYFFMLKGLKDFALVSHRSRLAFSSRTNVVTPTHLACTL